MTPGIETLVLRAAFLGRSETLYFITKSFAMKIMIKIAAFCLALGLPLGCGIEDAILETGKLLHAEMEKFLYDINETQNVLGSGVTDIVNELKTLNDKIGRDPQADMHYNLDLIIREVSVALIKTELCGIESVRRMALDLMDKMVQEIFVGAQAIAPLTPLICQSSLGSINLDAKPELRQTFELVGTSLFENSDSIYVVLVKANGETLKLVNALYFQQFSITVKIGHYPDDVLQNYLYLAVRSGSQGRDLLQLPILPKIERPKLTKSVTSNTVLAFVIPPKISKGDPDFGCNGPQGYIEVNLNYDLKRLTGYLYMYGAEWAYDWTLVKGKGASYLLYEAPPGWKIKSVSLPSGLYKRGVNAYYFVQSYRDDNCATENRPFPTPLGQISYVGATPNYNEAGSLTRADITFTRFNITIEEI